MAKVKRGRDRIRSQGYRDGRNHDSEMSMDRPSTKRNFEVQEIVTAPKTFKDRKATNKAALAGFQSKLKPIRGS